MIHVVIGTKAQLIKMYPIIHLLEEKNIPYNYIDTEQHPEITKKLRKQFKTKEPDYSFKKSEKNIISNAQGIIWMIKIFFSSIFNGKKIFKNDKKGLCLVHGDTVSTILGAIMGKFAGQRIVHIEAGFRTNSLFKPFPEEIIRRVTDKISYMNFALSDDSAKNLQKEKNKAINVNVKENTLIDTVNLAKKSNSNIPLPEKYILVSIHRYETIHSKKRLKFIVETIKDLSKNNKIIWGLHEPTKKALIKFDLLKLLENNDKVILKGLFDYFDFIRAISKSDFLITDGGGPQDETRYLNIPCLLMRTENERPNQKHIFQSEFETEKVKYFLENINKFKTKADHDYSPSKKIVEILSKHL